MVHLLRHQRDAGHEAERFAEIAKCEALADRVAAVRFTPAVQAVQGLAARFTCQFFSHVRSSFAGVFDSHALPW